jgi:hypothetical protein
MRKPHSLRVGGRLTVALIVAGAVFGIVTAVQAAIPDASGVLHGCYNAQGTLRVIDSPSVACKNGETAIPWNQRGITGAKGMTGARGPTGLKGHTGASGPSGVRGPSGTNGINGQNGADGVTGATGPTGHKGPTGAPGPSSLDTTTIASQPVDVPPHVVNPAVSATATCPAGMMAVSGGFFISNLDPNAPPGALISYRPSLDKWQVFFYNPSTSTTIQAQALAYCAPTS